MNQETYDKLIAEAREVFIDRQGKYGDSISVVDLHTIVGIILMKLNRIYKLGSHSKVKDELLDSLNYCVFGLDKLEKLK